VDEQAGLTDADVKLLNDARALLTQYAEWCANQSWQAPSGPGSLSLHDASAADYGRLHALAGVAEDSIFAVLNWTNSYGLRKLSKPQLHNWPADAA